VVAGVVTFDDLKIDLIGDGYTLLTSAAAVDAVTSAPFNVRVSLPAPPRTGVTP